MGNVLGSLKPASLWNHFEEMCAIPRPSRKEQKVAEYVKSIGTKNNLVTEQDDFGNVLIRKPATPGMEHLKTVTLQGHLDMVAEKNSDVKHDFDTDPIQPYIEGDWVKAKGTTLGSDNGIGAAAALAVLESKDIPHGPIEAIFTLDEETGLFGAQALKPGWLKGEIMLNLDSEEDGALYIGCAGGQNTLITFKFKPENVPANTVVYDINITGLKGGHSGLDIVSGRGNAIKLLTRLLWELNNKFGIRLVKMNGGSKHNAIPRECFSVIRVGKSKAKELEKFVAAFNKTVKNELASVEPNLAFKAVASKSRDKVIDAKTSDTLLNALYAIPNGVLRMSPDIEGLVQTSTNTAVIVTDEKTITLTTSQRSSAASEKEDASNMVASVFNLAKAKVVHTDSYPGWNPDIHSPVLGVMKKMYKELYTSDPEVKAIHAGLECGIIKERYPNMDMISFGPTIVGAHSPDERVQISTVEKFWDLLLYTLKNAPAK